MVIKYNIPTILSFRNQINFLIVNLMFHNQCYLGNSLNTIIGQNQLGIKGKTQITLGITIAIYHNNITKVKIYKIFILELLKKEKLKTCWEFPYKQK